MLEMKTREVEATEGRATLASRRAASRRVASRRAASRRVASRRVASRRVASKRLEVAEERREDPRARCGMPRSSVPFSKLTVADKARRRLRHQPPTLPRGGCEKAQMLCFAHHWRRKQNERNVGAMTPLGSMCLEPIVHVHEETVVEAKGGIRHLQVHRVGVVRANLDILKLVEQPKHRSSRRSKIECTFQHAGKRRVIPLEVCGIRTIHLGSCADDDARRPNGAAAARSSVLIKEAHDVTDVEPVLGGSCTTLDGDCVGIANAPNPWEEALRRERELDRSF